MITRTMQLGLLSKYRVEMMGVATIMILICHGPGNGIKMPKLLEYAIVQGQIGVDIFLFLSGMGLWYSLTNYARSTVVDVKRWYAKRYIRILVPYLIIMSVKTAITCIMDGESFWFFLSVVSTLEFWLSHRAAWFIALLLPLYLLAPLFFKMLKEEGLLKLACITIFCYCIALYPNDVREWTVFKNIQFAIIRVPVFVLGMYMAPKIQKNEMINLNTFWLLLSGAVVMLFFTRKPVNSYLFIVIPFLMVISKTFMLCENGKWNRICQFFGQISLESYLLNSIGPLVLVLMTSLHISDYNNLLKYSMVLIIGTFLSVYIHKLSKPIIAKLNKTLACNTYLV